MLGLGAAMVLVSFLWGATNPLIKKGSSGVNKIKCDNCILQFLSEIHFLARNWRYVLPFILNQSGSVVYYFTLQQADLSLAVPVVNSLTFVFTALSGWVLGEEIPNKGTLMGMLLVVSGITLCVFDKVTNFNSVA
ncbi:Transmembrane protein 234 homolog [Gryllus bimaculatus]|nr:Transmembrane protein 234 homolog [Gryllus bimaculatus]